MSFSSFRVVLRQKPVVLWCEIIKTVMRYRERHLGLRMPPRIAITSDFFASFDAER